MYISICIEWPNARGAGKNCGAEIGPSRPRATGNRSRATENLAKSRTIDLRLSDKLMSDGRWSTIKSIEADRQNWITDERATALQDNDGYAYLLQGETRTPEELRKANHV